MYSRIIGLRIHKIGNNNVLRAKAELTDNGSCLSLFQGAVECARTAPAPSPRYAKRAAGTWLATAPASTATVQTKWTSPRSSTGSNSATETASSPLSEARLASTHRHQTVFCLHT